jgi:hypothetical protein
MATLRHYYRMICRMIWWGWKLRNSHDWDYGYMDEIIYLKLERMQKEMLQNGHCVWNSDPKSKEYYLMRKLEQAVYTAKIITEEEEEPIYQIQMKRHEEKYGEINMKWGFGGEEWDAYHEIGNNHSFRIKQYRKHLHTLLYKYGTMWWD